MLTDCCVFIDIDCVFAFLIRPTVKCNGCIGCKYKRHQCLTYCGTADITNCTGNNITLR